jgi:hypothetical protein
LFHPEGDHHFRICRLPIGASDYALDWYSHNETDGDIAMALFHRAGSALSDSFHQGSIETESGIEAVRKSFHTIVIGQ